MEIALPANWFRRITEFTMTVAIGTSVVSCIAVEVLTYSTQILLRASCAMDPTSQGVVAG